MPAPTVLIPIYGMVVALLILVPVTGLTIILTTRFAFKPLIDSVVRAIREATLPSESEREAHTRLEELSEEVRRLAHRVDHTQDVRAFDRALSQEESRD